MDKILRLQQLEIEETTALVDALSSGSCDSNSCNTTSPGHGTA
ncbi:class III lanthipeptide [Kitasatospora acidiphila]|nr:class III lanthipeptide [Kitasatospora acidiphila]